MLRIVSSSPFQAYPQGLEEKGVPGLQSSYALGRFKVFKGSSDEVIHAGEEHPVTDLFLQVESENHAQDKSQKCTIVVDLASEGFPLKSYKIRCVPDDISKEIDSSKKPVRIKAEEA